MDGEETVLFKSVNSSVFHLIDNSVTPFTSYTYYVEVENSAGQTAGPSSTILSPEAGQSLRILETCTILDIMPTK